MMREKFLGLSIGKTLCLILFLGLTPALVMGKYFVVSQMSEIEIAEKELVGTEILREIQPVDQFIARLPQDEELRKTKAKKAHDLLVRAIKHEDHVAELNSAKSGQAVLNALSAIQAGANVDGRQAMDNFVQRIGDQSGLILDPQLDSYYLMDIVLVRSRDLAKAANELERAYPSITGPRDPIFLILRHRVADSARALQTAMTNAINGDVTGTLQNGRVPDTTSRVIMEANKLIQTKSVVADHSALHAALAKNWSASINALEISIKARHDKIEADLINGLIVSGLAALTVILLAGLLISSLTSGLRNISNRLADLSDGDFITPVPGTEFNNDIGIIAAVLQDFIDSRSDYENARAKAQAELERAVAEVRAENEALLAEALKRQAEASVAEREMIGRLASELENQVSGLLAESSVSAQQMKNEASAMAGSVNGVQQQSSAAAHAATDIRAAVQNVAPTVEAVSAQLQQYTASLGDAKNLATDAVARAGLANRKIGEFDDATKRAAKMLQTITSVAHRTNMLALNASIEAMRVGDAGQGFMVVAGEVKALARSTRDTAHQIAQQISAMEGARKEVADAFEQMLEVVNTLADRSILVAGGMDDQASAIAQVDASIQRATQELEELVNRVSSADKSAGSALLRSREMLDASENVSTHFGALDNSVRSFLGNVKNAQRQTA